VDRVLRGAKVEMKRPHVHVPLEVDVLIAAGSFKIAAKQWCPPNASDPVKILAWPGWLDNAGSFDNIAPYFVNAGFQFFAVDPPGCGRSDHRPPYDWYLDYEEVGIIGQIATAVWGDKEKFVLCGHSRGGGICALGCSVLKDRVLAGILFESSLGVRGTYPGEANDIAPQTLALARERDHKHRNDGKGLRVFNSLEDAIQMNAHNEIFPKVRSTAENIVLRHITQRPDGKWTFTHDRRTYGQLEPLCMTEDVQMELLRSIECPVLHATNPIGSHPWDNNEEHVLEIQRRVEAIPNITTTEVPGNHHVHSDAPQMVAYIAIPWLIEALKQKPMTVNKVQSPARPAPFNFSKMGKKKASQIPQRISSSFRNNSDSFGIEGVDLKLPLFGGSFHLAVKVHFPLQYQTQISQPRDDGPEKLDLLCVHPSKRIICWPGWLDNAGSFEAIASHFTKEGYLLVCCDPPGCGRSSHYAKVTMYSDFLEPSIAIEALDALGWTSPCNFMAHSRGGSIATLTVSSFPDRFCRMILFDSSMALFKEPAQIASGMRVAFDADQNRATAQPRKFSTVNDMILHNHTNPQFPKSINTAAAIVYRHACPLQDGRWTFSHDARTYGESQPLRASPRQQDQFFSSLTVPTILVMGTKSKIGAFAIKDKGQAVAKFKEIADTTFPDDLKIREAFLVFQEQRWEEFQHRLRSSGTEITVEWCEGGMHHFHSDLPDVAAKIVLDWIERTEKVSQLSTADCGLVKVPDLVPPLEDAPRVQLSATNSTEPSIEEPLAIGHKSRL